MHILLIDNHDSFTYNLAELLRRIGKVTFNILTSDELDIPEAEQYHRIIFSPGPGLPEEHPLMNEILQRYAGRIPILGVCLGMQAIAQYYGASLYNLPQVVHGRPERLNIHDRVHPIFRNIPDGAEIGLYHSWAVNPATLPPCLKVLARSGEGIIMALAHKELDVCGVQFHPESFMTKSGVEMVRGWIVSGDVIGDLV